MAILGISLIDRSGEWTGDKHARHYQDVYQVFASRTDNQAQVIGGALTSLGYTVTVTGFSSDPTAILAKASAKLVEHTTGANKWTVTLSYDTSEPLELEENPLADEVQFSASYEKFNRPLLTDLSDDELPILNSAGEPFESVPEQESS